MSGRLSIPGRLAALVIGSFPALVAAPRCASALEINTATRAQLEQLSGVGVDLAERILDERAKAPFHDWVDLTRRVKGLKQRRAESLSRQGLTVQGSSGRPDGEAPSAGRAGDPISAGQAGADAAAEPLPR
jgi:competence protein ComEA